MTNSFIAVVAFVQIVTNWGPVGLVGQYGIGIGDVSTYAHIADQYTNRYQHGTIASQDMVRVVNADRVTNEFVVESTTLETVSRYGVEHRTIQWTNEVTNAIYRWNTADVTNLLWSNSNSLVITNLCIEYAAPKKKRWWNYTIGDLFE